MRYKIAPDIKEQVRGIVKALSLSHIDIERIYCIRSFGVKTRAVARIWGIPKIFKEVAGIKPCYIIEVNSKKFDPLGEKEKTKTLIHELLHIPKTFSGALLSHRGRYHRIDEQRVKKILKRLKED